MLIMIRADIYCEPHQPYETTLIISLLSIGGNQAQSD